MAILSGEPPPPSFFMNIFVILLFQCLINSKIERIVTLLFAIKILNSNENSDSGILDILEDQSSLICRTFILILTVLDQ